MRKKIIIGSLLAGIFLLLVPAVQAIKYNTLEKENKSLLFEKSIWINQKKQWEKLDGGIGLLEMIIAFLLFLYIQLGIIFNRNFRLILLLADLLYEMGVIFDLIEQNCF